MKDTVLPRTPKLANGYFWDVVDCKMDEKAWDDVNYIVHLAGSKLKGGRYALEIEAFKRSTFSSP